MTAFIKFVKDLFTAAYDLVVVSITTLIAMFAMFLQAAQIVRLYYTVVPTHPIVGWAAIACFIGTMLISFKWVDEKTNALPSFQRVNADVTYAARGVAFYVVFFFAAIFTVVANATMWVAEKTLAVAERYQK